MAPSTAIARGKASAPARWLVARGLVAGDVLDYGCGRGRDALTYGWAGWDPSSGEPHPLQQYDRVICTYVFNTLPDEHEREATAESIRGLLKPDGAAYLAVRRDRAKLQGYTRRGTWQGFIHFLELPMLKRTGSFAVFELTRDAPSLHSLVIPC